MKYGIIAGYQAKDIYRIVIALQKGQLKSLSQSMMLDNFTFLMINVSTMIKHFSSLFVVFIIMKNEILSNTIWLSRNFHNLFKLSNRHRFNLKFI